VQAKLQIQVQVQVREHVQCRTSAAADIE
jgi:hypothetical protein